MNAPTEDHADKPRPRGRPSKKTQGEPTRRKQISMDAAQKAALQGDAGQAKQTVTDYLHQALEGVLDGTYPPVDTRAPLVFDAQRRPLEITLPLSLSATCDDLAKARGLTFTDFVLGAWQQRRTAENAEQLQTPTN